jgi:TonB family protein
MLRSQSICVLLLLIASYGFGFQQAASPEGNGTSSSPAATSSDKPQAQTATQPPAVMPGDSTQLELVKKVTANYPLEAQGERIQGQVRLRLHVSENGDVENVDVLSGDPILVPSAVSAAKKWKFKPFIRNGKPAKVATDVPFNFAFTEKVTDVTETAPAQASSAGTSNASQPVRLPTGVAAGMLIHRVAPVYPPDARHAHIEGVVVLHAIIGKDGAIKDLTVITGPKELTRSAIGAVQQWRYRPYTLNGEPVVVDTQIQVNYRLSP